MSNQVVKAKIKIKFEEGIELNQNSTYEEVLRILSGSLNNEAAGQVTVKVEYEDGSETKFERAEDEDEGEEEDQPANEEVAIEGNDAENNRRELFKALIQELKGTLR